MRHRTSSLMGVALLFSLSMTSPHLMPAQLDVSGGQPASWIDAAKASLEPRRGNIPLSFLLGWIAVESGGDLSRDPSLKGERGYFQIGRFEWCYIYFGGKSKGCEVWLEGRAESALSKSDAAAKATLTKAEFDNGFNAFKKLSTDPNYSLQMGIKLVETKARDVRGWKLGCDENANSHLFWHLVKLTHTTYNSAVRLLLSAMWNDGITPDSWRAISEYIKANQKKLLTQTKIEFGQGVDFAWAANNVDGVFRSGAEIEAKESQAQKEAAARQEALRQQQESQKAEQARQRAADDERQREQAEKAETRQLMYSLPGRWASSCNKWQNDPGSCDSLLNPCEIQLLGDIVHYTCLDGCSGRMDAGWGSEFRYDSTTGLLVWVLQDSTPDPRFSVDRDIIRINDSDSLTYTRQYKSGHKQVCEWRRVR